MHHAHTPSQSPETVSVSLRVTLAYCALQCFTIDYHAAICPTFGCSLSKFLDLPSLACQSRASAYQVFVDKDDAVVCSVVSQPASRQNHTAARKFELGPTLTCRLKPAILILTFSRQQFVCRQLPIGRPSADRFFRCQMSTNWFPTVGGKHTHNDYIPTEK